MPTSLRSHAHPPQQTQQIFTALMWSLSYPGQLQALPSAGWLDLGRAVLGADTSFYTPDPQLQKSLAATGAKVRPPAQADYLFYPRLEPHDIAPLAAVKRGDLVRPLTSATLILQARFGVGTRLSLSGPGVQAGASLYVDGVPNEFWETRNRVCHYPLGWDVFMHDGTHLVALPRSTTLWLAS